MISLKKIDKKDINIIEDLQIKSFSCYSEIKELNLKKEKTFLKLPTMLLERPNFLIFKVILSEKIIGALYIKIIKSNICEIYRLFIDPLFQGLGYGSQAISEIISLTPRFTDYYLYTPKCFRNNESFYSKNGFIVEDEVMDRYGFIKLKFHKKIERKALTALKPSDGGLHLGHLVGNIEPLIKYQNVYNCTFMFADMQVRNIDNKYYNWQVLKENMKLMLKQMIALGLDVEKVNIRIESKIKKNAFDEFIFFSDFIKNTRLQRLPLMKHIIQENKNIKMSILNYPILQTLDFTINDADLVFSNGDNQACIELINELIKKINSSSFRSYKTVKLLTGKVSLLEGIDGMKMSKSKNNCIFLTDTNEQIRKKVNKMFTDSNRTSEGIPGNISQNIVFKYLFVFANEKLYNDLKTKYENGEIGDSKLKNILSEILIDKIEKYRKKFETISDKLIDDLLS